MFFELVYSAVIFTFMRKSSMNSPEGKRHGSSFAALGLSTASPIRNADKKEAGYVPR
jgi:hypothetical protein